MNEQMADLPAQPGVPHAFGLIGGEATAIARGKPPLSSMPPVLLVKDGAVVMCAGGSGGPLIVSETAQAIINMVDFALDAEAAVSAPRIHAQWVPDALLAEPDIPADVREGLARRGEKIIPAPPNLSGGAIQVVVVRPVQLEAASDPRKGGVPAAP